MRNILSLLFVCAIFVHVTAWVGIIKADPATAHLGDCYTDDLGAFRIGEVKQIERRCSIATCHAGGDIGLTGCGSVGAKYPLRVLPGDLSKPFPKCCPRIVGPDNVTDSHQERVPNARNVQLGGALLNHIESR